MEWTHIKESWSLIKTTGTWNDILVTSVDKHEQKCFDLFVFHFFSRVSYSLCAGNCPTIPSSLISVQESGKTSAWIFSESVFAVSLCNSSIFWFLSCQCTMADGWLSRVWHSGCRVPLVMLQITYMAAEGSAGIKSFELSDHCSL